MNIEELTCVVGMSQHGIDKMIPSFANLQNILQLLN